MLLTAPRVFSSQHSIKHSRQWTAWLALAKCLGDGQATQIQLAACNTLL